MRKLIKDAFIATIARELDGSNSGKYFNSDIYGLVGGVRRFEQLKEFPYIAVSLGTETTEYLPGRQRWNYLPIHIFAYVRDEDDDTREEVLENLLQDLKNIIDSDLEIRYNIIKPDGSNRSHRITDRTINTVGTDEGLLSPFGFGEINLTVRYSPDSRLI